MLLSAGYSLGAALSRLAKRGQGACGQDLRRVFGRIRQGLTEVDAAPRVGRPRRPRRPRPPGRRPRPQPRAGDLGRLIAEEARSIRREVQRELIEQIERRSQQVWIPVTVAALVPGALFIAVPFIEALRVFSAS